MYGLWKIEENLKCEAVNFVRDWFESEFYLENLVAFWNSVMYKNNFIDLMIDIFRSIKCNLGIPYGIHFEKSSNGSILSLQSE